ADSHNRRAASRVASVGLSRVPANSLTAVLLCFLGCVADFFAAARLLVPRIGFFAIIEPHRISLAGFPLHRFYSVDSRGVGGSMHTDFGSAPSQIPSNEGWRRMPSRVHVVNLTATTICGSTQFTPPRYSFGTDAKGEAACRSARASQEVALG